MSGYGPTFTTSSEAVCEYVCGQCGSPTRLKPGEPIQCRECGYRILYKKRTRKVVQFEAR
jgi:DNA-directed RNA polymerase I, II, and III subunit RPABC4